MLRFAYWAVNTKTKEEVNFVSENYYDTGAVIHLEDDPDTEVRIVDFAPEEDTRISAAELLEDWRMM